MTDSINPSDRAAVEAIVANLETAWNTGDGNNFGASFSVDADFVTIRAVRLLRPDVALVHVHSVLNAPSGPLAGSHTARFSAVLTHEAGGWQIASLHNTLAPGGGSTAVKLQFANGVGGWTLAFQSRSDH